ncbi:polygalacturonase-like [Cylas formicarius]|uniref:polygalacturonase-like n=1 Tax=Cylas formicarius TaxID=197179 RepID=UPI002958B40E|nr:polygalacturonase-like [Cylas formicarius]
MLHEVVAVAFLVATGSVSASPTLKAGCTVSNYDDVAGAVSSCTEIVIKDMTVPAGKALDMSLKSGTKLTFQGKISFAKSNWEGPLIQIKGSKLTVQGASGHVLDGQGQLYWDGKGSSGTKKPKFFRIKATGGSVFKDINLLNCPVQCVSINSASDLTVSGFNIDVSAGDSGDLGHNTDGFDISSSNNIVVKDSVVKNQDDCVAVNQGSNMVFQNLDCSGGHGLSLSVGFDDNDASKNTVKNVTFTDSSVKNSRNGIHVKTHSDSGPGLIQDVTYKNIKLSNIERYGINVQEDYEDGSSSGNAKGNIPIKNLRMNSVTGTMTGSNSIAVYILCGSGGCSSWNWDGVNITGNKKSNSCNFSVTGFKC